MKITADFRAFYPRLTQDPQLRWIGPEKASSTWRSAPW